MSEIQYIETNTPIEEPTPIKTLAKQEVIEKNSSTKPAWESKKFVGMVGTFGAILTSATQYVPDEYKAEWILGSTVLGGLYILVQGVIDAINTYKNTK